MAQLEVKFDKGLNSAIDFMTNAPGHCLTFSDYQQNYGILIPRAAGGIVNQTAIGSSSDQIDGLGFWTDTSQSHYGYQVGNLYINDATNGKFYRSSLYSPINEGTITVTDITNSVAQNTAPITFASLNGILVYTGTGGNVNKITSHTANCASLAGVSAAFTIVRTVNNIMFGTPAAPAQGSANSTVYWSNVNDPTTWPVGSNITFRNNDGDAIQALGELNGNLLIFKQLSIGLLSTTSTLASGVITLAPLTTLFQGIGCAGPCAVDNLPDGRCVFLGTDFNVYVTDGSSLTSLTNNPPPGLNLIAGITSSIQLIGPSMYLRYYPFRNEIVLSGISNSGSTPYCFAYDVQQNYWRKITGFHPYSMCVVKHPNDATHTSVLLFGNNLGNVVDWATTVDGVPKNEDASTLATPDLSASVVIPQNFFNSDLVCLTILYQAHGSTVPFRYGFDNSYGNTINLPSANNRVDLKVALKALSNNQRPSSFQINFTDNGNGNIAASIYRIILSDEVTA